MLSALTDSASSYLAPSAKVQSPVHGGSRRVSALAARMERPGTVGELVAAASALCAQGAYFYAEVDTTADARVAGVVQAWICSDPSMVQSGEAPEECFYPMGAGTYVTADEYGRYLWTFVPAGRAWLVLVEWQAAWR